MEVENMMKYGGYGMSLIGLVFACIIMLLILAAIILGVVLLVRYLRKSQNNPQMPYNNALNILNERYAKGEISDEEYKKKKAELKG
jgi:Predicted membrane protein